MNIFHNIIVAKESSLLAHSSEIPVYLSACPNNGNWIQNNYFRPKTQNQKFSAHGVVAWIFCANHHVLEAIDDGN